jgi:hypothetical protein
MSRGTLAWISLGLVVMAAGCRMCASPYDSCSPTFTGQPGEQCAPTARAGSILSGYFPPILGEGYGPDEVPNLPELPEQQVPESEADLPALESEPMSESEGASDGRVVPDAGLLSDGDGAAHSKADESRADGATLARKTRPARSQRWTAVKRTEARLP